MLLVHTDACKKGKNIGLGWTIERNGEMIVKGKKYLEGAYSSMEAECMALIRAMRSALRYSDGYITFYTDCLPLVNHIDDGNPITDGGYLDTVEQYTGHLPPHMLMWTPRENNEEADRQAHVAIDEEIA